MFRNIPVNYVYRFENYEIIVYQEYCRCPKAGAYEFERKIQDVVFGLVSFNYRGKYYSSKYRL